MTSLRAVVSNPQSLPEQVRAFYSSPDLEVDAEDLIGIEARSAREYREWDESKHPRGKTTPASRGGSFRSEEQQVIDQPPEAYQKTNASPSMLDVLGGVDTLQQFTQPDGELTPERQRLHDAIVAEALKGHVAQASPVVYLMGGGGGSGKTVMQAQLRGLPLDRVHVDVDIVRTKLPEWGAELRAAAAEGRRPNTYLGSYTHEEASLISKRIISSASRARYNLLIDGAGDTSIDKLAKNIDLYTQGEHRVVANYVTVDYDEAYTRMRARGDRIGRYIPAAHLREVHSEVARTFPVAVHRGYFDEYALWDTTGSQLKKVASGTKSTDMTIHDRAAWNKFLERGKGIAPRSGEI